MKNKIAGTLALISAGLASACCLGPIVLAGLGLGGVGLAAGLERYRPYFLAATAALLAVAFYRVYRVRGECATGSCPPRPSRAVKGALWLATLAAVGLASFPAWGPLLVQTDELRPASDAQVINLAVNGMDCPACVAGIVKALKEIPGVQDAAVDFDRKAAVVYATPGRVASEQLIRAISAAGPYSARLEEN